MTDSAYQKMWSLAASAYVTLVATLFARTTSGGKPTELFGFVSDITASTVPAIGLPVDLLAGLGMLMLTYGWAYTHSHCDRIERIPCFQLTDNEVDPSTTIGKVYRVFTVIVVHGLTLVATCQMLSRYFDQPVYQCGGAIVITGGLEHFDYVNLRRGANEQMLCFGAPAAPETFAWLPWLYVLLVAFFFALWLVTVWRIFAVVSPSVTSPTATPFPKLDL